MKRLMNKVAELRGKKAVMLSDSAAAVCVCVCVCVSTHYSQVEADLMGIKNDFDLLLAALQKSHPFDEDQEKLQVSALLHYYSEYDNDTILSRKCRSTCLAPR